MSDPHPKPSREAIGVGIFILAFAALMAWQTSIIPTGGGYAQIGPTVIPWIIVTMIGILGAVITVQASTGWWIVETERRPVQYKALGWIGVGLLLNLLMIGTLGFVLASSAMFLCVARGFGSTKPARDAGLGFAIAMIAFFGFDRLLGYRIGEGLIENLF